MTTGIDIDAMIRSAMAAGIVHNLVPQQKADLMRARLDEMTSGHPSHDCLMCTVRQLTEGTPNVWAPGEPAVVTGVVLKIEEVSGRFGMITCVDLWIDGFRRIRVTSAYGSHFKVALEKAAPQVGDTLTVEYMGHRSIQNGKFAGRLYRHYEVNVKRGHH